MIRALPAAFAALVLAACASAPAPVAMTVVATQATPPDELELSTEMECMVDCLQDALETCQDCAERCIDRVEVPAVIADLVPER